MRNRIIAYRHRWRAGELPGWLVAFIAAVIAADLIVIGACAVVTRFRGADLELAGVLLACNLLTVELTHRAGEPAGLVKDVHAIWELPLALLLPPLYGLLVPIPRMVLVQWRVRATLVHRRVFTAAAVGLSYGAASAVFHRAEPVLAGGGPGRPGPAAGLGPGRGRLRGAQVGGEQGAGDDRGQGGRPSRQRARPVVHPRAPVPRRRRALRGHHGRPRGHGQPVPGADRAAISRAAAPLLPARPAGGRLPASTPRPACSTSGTWLREARLETARAARTRTPLTVAIADIDHFKNVNDTFGHLTGDAVLAAIASALSALLREGDLTGRFGGEEFAILLPGTDAAEARQITERLREKISRIVTPVGDGHPVDQSRVTISIGVAALGSSRLDLDELLAAADHALYQAKESRAEPGVRAGRRPVIRRTGLSW